MATANAAEMGGAPNPKIQKTDKKQGKKVRKRLKSELAQLMMGSYVVVFFPFFFQTICCEVVSKQYSPICLVLMS